uniref:hypothetical protein n=1 Tax=Marinitenerispora sediminis TaxID=1931232 RepID=UPI001F311CAE|nr:hypothetical protein [Marinitenerispora sediminis]
MHAAPSRTGHLFPRLPGQSKYNRHLRALAPVLFAVARRLARATPTYQEKHRLMDGTPLPCGASRATVDRSGLGEIAG